MKLRKIRTLLTLFILLVIVLEAVSVYLSNTIAGTSVEVANLRQEIEAVNEKNVSLKTELLSYASYERIASRAAELGFVESRDSAIMVHAPLQVALVH